MNKKWKAQIEKFQPYNAQERQDKKVLLKYINQFDNIFYRENEFAHMTSSPWIINQDATKVLMIYHNIYNSWGWCGGHCDGDEDSIGVALREGQEESGIENLSLLSNEILAIDILPVPPHVKHEHFVSSHVHLNVTYVCIADEHDAIRIKPDENSGVKWIDVKDINRIVREEDMKPVYQKLMEKTLLLLVEKEKTNT